MALSRCRRVLILLLSGSLPYTLAARASDVESSKNIQPVQVNAAAGTIEPQIVRISYLEGDVRVARGTKGAAWEAAVSGLPIEAGFTLSTGAGRAEIEFEDTSTVYLDRNSVLNFNDLISAGNIPYTGIALLTGTLTLNVHPVAGEAFVLTTPTNRLTIRSPLGGYSRVTSYLDAMAVTPQEPLKVNIPPVPGSGEENLAKGQTTLYHAEGLPTAGDATGAEDFSEWDHWVAGRVAARAEAMAAVMKESGLTAPIPGLADLYGQGTFFSCQPYGTCWEPKDSGAEDTTSSQAAAVRPASLISANLTVTRSAGGFHYASLQTAALVSPAGYGQDPWTGQTTPMQRRPNPIYDDFPCYPPGVRASLATTRHVTGSPYYRNSYDWALCHAGSWIYHGHRYAWVAGTHKHHHCPIHWVKSGRTVAFVPIHPRDVRGKAPLNSQHEVFAVAKKDGLTVQRVSLDSGAKMKLLSEAPREARGEYHEQLARAADPAPVIHHSGALLTDSGLKDAGTRLTFNHHSQSFMLGKETMLANHNMTQLQSFNRSIGNLQSRAGGGGAAHNGFASSGGGGHFSGGSGGSSSGGAAHSGGASSSSGSSGGGASSGGGSHR